MKDKLLTSKRRVRFQDCDPFNHLNNGKYIDYFVNAREDQISEHYGLNIFELAQIQKKAWLIADHKIAYINPVKTNEEIIIESQLINYSSKSIVVEMKMYDSERKRIKSILWSTYIHFNLLTQRTAEHDKDMLQLFGEVESQLQTSDFNERVQEIKKVA